MLVEMYEEGGQWYFKDQYEVPFCSGMGSGIKPLEVKETKDNIKKIIKLKEAGFNAEEIIDMKNGGLL